MKLFLSALLVLIVASPRAFAGSETYADERLLVTTSTVVGFTAATMLPPTGSEPPCGALVTAYGQNIRFYLSGTLPTPTSGHVLTAGNSVFIDSRKDMDNFRAIGDVSNSTITVSYQRGCRP